MCLGISGCIFRRPSALTSISRQGGARAFQGFLLSPGSDVWQLPQVAGFYHREAEFCQALNLSLGDLYLFPPPLSIGNCFPLPLSQKSSPFTTPWRQFLRSALGFLSCRRRDLCDGVLSGQPNWHSFYRALGQSRWWDLLSPCHASSLAHLWDYKEAAYSGTTKEAEDGQGSKLWELGEVSKKGKRNVFNIRTSQGIVPHNSKPPFAPGG